jgi:hypothetical protein
MKGHRACGVVACVMMLVAGTVLCGTVLGQAGGKPGDWGTPPAKTPGNTPGKTPGGQAPTTPAPSETAKIATVDLRPRFEVGRVTRYVQTVDSESLGGLASGIPGGLDGISELTGSTPGEKPVKTRLVETSDVQMKTTAVDAETGQATVEMTTTRVRVEINSDDFSFAYDSAKKNAPGTSPGKPASTPASNPADGITGDMLEAVLEGFYGKKVGQTLRLTVNRDGSIAKVEGGGGMSPDGLAGLSGIGGGASQGMDGLFGPVRSGGVGSIDVSQVRVGQRWSHESKVMVGPVGELAMRTDHILRGAGRSEATIEFAGTVKTDTSEQTGGRLANIGPSTYQGTMIWDRTKGELRRFTSTMEIGATTARPTQPTSTPGQPAQRPGTPNTPNTPGMPGTPGASGNGGKESQSKVRMTFERVDR